MQNDGEQYALYVWVCYFVGICEQERYLCIMHHVWNVVHFNILTIIHLKIYSFSMRVCYSYQLFDQRKSDWSAHQCTRKITKWFIMSFLLPFLSIYVYTCVYINSCGLISLRYVRHWLHYVQCMQYARFYAYKCFIWFVCETWWVYQAAEYYKFFFFFRFRKYYKNEKCSVTWAIARGILNNWNCFVKIYEIVCFS